MLKTSFKILVIGDTCIDQYKFGFIKKQNPEAPVPLFVNSREEFKLGMAHNVANNIKALGSSVVIKCPEPKITKTRYIDDRTQTQIFRVDEDFLYEPYKLETEYNFDCIVISDYNKGFIDNELVYKLSKLFEGPIFVDTKKTSLVNVQNVYYKINFLEYTLLHNTVPNLIVTLGDRGCMFNGKYFSVSKTNVVDVCGAGDVFLAALAVGFLSYNSIPSAIELANKCASLSCKHLGAYSLSEKDIKCVS